MMKTPSLRSYALYTKGLEAKMQFQQSLLRPRIAVLLNFGHNCDFKILGQLKIAVPGD